MTNRACLWVTACLTALLSIAAAAPAGAVTLVTPSLDVAQADNLVCRVVNAGSKAITVKLEVVDAITGTAAVEDELTIAPGKAQVIDTFDVGITGYCRFSGSFRRGDVRASMDVFSGERTVLITPAQ